MALSTYSKGPKLRLEPKSNITPYTVPFIYTIVVVVVVVVVVVENQYWEAGRPGGWALEGQHGIA